MWEFLPFNRYNCDEHPQGGIAGVAVHPWAKPTAHGRDGSPPTHGTAKEGI
jgi:hypothetical protein